MNYTLDWLSDPEIFQVNRLSAHSDHKFYKNSDELQSGKSSFLQSLNGEWKISWAKNPQERKIGFYAEDYDTDAFDDIIVPGHMELQG